MPIEARPHSLSREAHLLMAASRIATQATFRGLRTRDGHNGEAVAGKRLDDSDRINQWKGRFDR